MVTSPSDADRTKAFVRLLSDPATHDVDASDIAPPIETHGAVVILAGNRAYKIKKPVKFPYMDLSTLELRRKICRREIEVNRLTAPRIYLRVAGIVERNGRLILIRDAETDPTAEPVVVMRRFDLSRTLDRVVETEALGAQIQGALVDEIVTLQSSAPFERTSNGTQRIRWILEMNARGLREGTPDVLDPEAVERLIELSDQEWKRARTVLDLRSRAGRVRRCHGDLHLGNIFLDVSNRPVLFDAIEFDEELATIDVAYDLAFLLMDLLQRGLWIEANRIWNLWLERMPGGLGDDSAAEPMSLFLAMRAAIRAEVGAAKAMQNPDSSNLVAEPRSYLEHAIDFLMPVGPRLIAIGGMSGTGKSTLARALAPHLGGAPGATILRSDAIRKRLAGVNETDRLSATFYTRAVSAKVYATLNRRAGRHIRGRRTVIADAVFGQSEERYRIGKVASHAGVPYTGIWLDLPVDAAKSRVASRKDDVSDATQKIVDRQAGFVSTPRNWLVLDAGLPIETLVDQVLGHLEVRRRY